MKSLLENFMRASNGTQGTPFEMSLNKFMSWRGHTFAGNPFWMVWVKDDLGGDPTEFHPKLQDYILRSEAQPKNQVLEFHYALKKKFKRCTAYHREAECPACKGSGRDNPPSWAGGGTRDCSHCNGSKKVGPKADHNFRAKCGQCLDTNLDREIVRIGEAFFDVTFLVFAERHLGPLRIAVPTEFMHPLYFEAREGIHGLIMNMGVVELPHEQVRSLDGYLEPLGAAEDSLEAR